MYAGRVHVWHAHVYVWPLDPTQQEDRHQSHKSEREISKTAEVTDFLIVEDMQWLEYTLCQADCYLIMHL